MSVSPEGSRIGFVGSHGYIHIADGASKQFIIDLKINATLKNISFLNEHLCITSGYDAEVYLWDLRYQNGKCISKFAHEDGTPTSFISSYYPKREGNPFFSLNNAYLSLGAVSGVNSVYEGTYNDRLGVYSFTNPDESQHAPKPMKAIMNLTTKVTSSAYHPSGQILAIASREVR